VDQAAVPLVAPGEQLDELVAIAARAGHWVRQGTTAFTEPVPTLTPAPTTGPLPLRLTPRVVGPPGRASRTVSRG
jgi:hypothetical protein